MDKEREINALADILMILTKELVENPTFAIKDAFKYVHREFVTETLASEAAYFDFLNKTGKDIRNYDWYGGKIKSKNGKTININTEYTAEHMQTGKQFKNELINAYQNGDLTKEFIKAKLKSRYLCWVTKEEDRKLKALGYNSERPDPEKAYKEAGIKIYCAGSEIFNTISSQMTTHQRATSHLANSKTVGRISNKSTIGETLTFTNEKIKFKNGRFAYIVYNEIGQRIGYVFECVDQRTPAYKNAELGFFNEYKSKKFCRFTSYGERVSWFYLCERIEKEENVVVYID